MQSGELINCTNSVAFIRAKSLISSAPQERSFVCMMSMRHHPQFKGKGYINGLGFFCKGKMNWLLLLAEFYGNGGICLRCWQSINFYKPLIERAGNFIVIKKSGINPDFFLVKFQAVPAFFLRLRRRFRFFLINSPITDRTLLALFFD